MKLWFFLLMTFAAVAFGADGVSFVNEGIVDAPVEEVWKALTKIEVPE